MPDRPATAEEKLYLRLQQAKDMGKRFDERLERRILGLPPVDGREPIYLEDVPDRRSRVLGEDEVARVELEKEARQLQEEAERSNRSREERDFLKVVEGDSERELAAEAEQANLRDLQEQLAQERQRREELEAQVETLRGEGPGPVETAPVSAPGEAQRLEGVPDDSWTKREMIQFLDQEGLEPFPGNVQFTRKAEILEHVREQARGRGPVTV